MADYLGLERNVSIASAAIFLLGLAGTRYGATGNVLGRTHNKDP